MSDHQSEQHCDDDEQAQSQARTVQERSLDPHELDFSRLRLARASLDNAFPQD